MHIMADFTLKHEILPVASIFMSTFQIWSKMSIQLCPLPGF